MTFPVLPCIQNYSQGSSVYDLSIVGQVLLPLSKISLNKHFLHDFQYGVNVFIDARNSGISLEKAVEVLNAGVPKIFIKESDIDAIIVEGGLPSYRFAVEVGSNSNAGKLAELQSSIVFLTKPQTDTVQNLGNSGNRSLYYDGPLNQEEANALAQNDIQPIINVEKLTRSSFQEGKISISTLFTSTLTTDRQDGLFTTLVTGPAPSYTALGVVYSSTKSIEASILEGVGVYQSRKRRNELWYKGKTSGATQKLIKIEKDCDSDVVKFIVQQKEGSGFCHLSNNYTCFHDNELLDRNSSVGHGLSKLDQSLQSRKVTAPEGSYTNRLFNDEKLLVSKLKEELDELLEAGKSKDKKEIAWECADLFYFALTLCIKNGVRLVDIEKNLDIKSLKVTRRKGDAKPAYMEKNDSVADTSDPYKMEVILASSKIQSADVKRALQRPVQKTADIMKLVLPIVDKVKSEGDKALIELTEKFDGVKLNSPVLNAPFPEDYMQISDELKEAIDISISNIEKFHAAQLPAEEVMTVETSPGVYCSRFAKPIENVGLYVPGGTAVLPSTAMMLGVPAKVAGCSNIIVASPPSRETGRLTPEVVYVAHKLGAKCIVVAGGAQAVTAMAYGTESVLKCDKILGPGNQFVTAAKMHVQNDTQALCSIDMPAGPSEVLVISDNDADPDFVASDLLSQAEHGVDSQVILIAVAPTQKKLEEIQEAVSKQADQLPRKEIVSKCLAHSYVLVVDNYEQAFDLSNEYAPEHLILQIKDARSYVPSHVQNAGSVFVGELSPESCGDYSSGTNHTLPTYGYARQYSGVNTATFQKFITSQYVTDDGLKSIGKAVMSLAAIEGLDAHRNAVKIRMEKLGLL